MQGESGSRSDDRVTVAGQDELSICTAGQETPGPSSASSYRETEETTYWLSTLDCNTIIDYLSTP